jgi:hypothetical protein
MFYSAMIVVAYYAHAAVVDFVVDFSNEFIVHYVVVIVIKAGIIHGGYVVIKKYRKHKKGANDNVAPKAGDKNASEK